MCLMLDFNSFFSLGLNEIITEDNLSTTATIILIVAIIGLLLFLF